MNRIKFCWLALALAALLMAGCAEFLLESKQESGQVRRVKLDSGESWESFDSKPRNPWDKRKTSDEMSIMLKSESTF